MVTLSQAGDGQDFYLEGSCGKAGKAASRAPLEERLMMGGYR